MKPKQENRCLSRNRTRFLEDKWELCPLNSDVLCTRGAVTRCPKTHTVIGVNLCSTNWMGISCTLRPFYPLIAVGVLCMSPLAVGVEKLSWPYLVWKRDLRPGPPRADSGTVKFPSSPSSKGRPAKNFYTK